MENYDSVLRRCSLFHGISKEELSAILNCLGAKVRTYRREQRIFTEGAEANHIGIVILGSAQIVKIDYYGNRSIVAKVEPAQLFGESYALSEVEKIPVDVVAAETTKVLLIDVRKLTTTCSSVCVFHQKMIYNLLGVVAKKNILLSQKIDITSKRSTREKLMTYLLMQAKEKQSSSFEVPFDRQELADYLGVDRSGLSAEISKLRKENELECRRNWFRLL